MRRRLWKAAGGALLAVVLGASTGAAPALATTGDAAEQVISATFSIFRIVRGGPNASDIENLVQIAVGQTTSVRNAVLTRFDAADASDAVAYATSAVNEFSDFNSRRFNKDALEDWTFDVGRGATWSAGRLDLVQDRRALDQIGHAVLIQYPIALAGAGAHGGLGNYYTRMRTQYIAAANNILSKLEPICTVMPGGANSASLYEMYHTCTAADGTASTFYERMEGSRWTYGPVNLDLLKESAARNSSWLVAKRVLPTIP